LHTGHQEAVTSIKIGFPAAWSASKVLWSKGFLSIADAIELSDRAVEMAKPPSK
jgi:hypothetical protein